MSSSSSPSTSRHDIDFYSHGILIDETPWTHAPGPVEHLIETLLDFKATIPPDCLLTIYYQKLRLYDRIACVGSDLTLVEMVYYGRGSKIDQTTITLKSTSDPTWIQPVSVALGCMFEDNGILAHIQATSWTATSLHPIVNGLGLDQPVPTFTVGFHSSQRAKTTGTATKNKSKKPGGSNRPSLTQTSRLHDDPFALEAIESMIIRNGAECLPYVSTEHPELIYPFFCFEVDTGTSGKDAVAGRLHLSLALALGILTQLKHRANDRSDLPVTVFGASSIGELWTLYVAYEPQNYEVGITCHICTIWTGRVEYENDGPTVEFLWLMERIKRWSLDTLRPQIESWLLAVVKS